MRSRRPYLLRAMHEWMVDTGQTPYVLVDVRHARVEVPAAYVQDGKIVLNVSPSAAHRLMLGNDTLEFDARFAGSPHHISVPIPAVLAIYARETGQGMMFGLEDDAPAAPADGLEPGHQTDHGKPESDKDGGGDRPRGRPSLKVVK
jgi:stringent starvation protein B